MPSDFKMPKTVAVLGCGSIGASWAALFAHHDLKVQVYDTVPEAEKKLKSLIAEAASTFAALEDTKATGSSDKLPSNVTFTTDLAEALKGADVVQENGPEDLKIKTELYSQIEETLGPEVPVLSSTSGLTVTEMAKKFKHPERFAVGHPFNPPHLIPLVEIVGGEKTSPETISWAMEFYKKIGKEPIHIKKQVPGHVANRLQAALFREIMWLIQEDVATVDDIEKAMQFGPGLRWGVMGPSTLFHLGGGEGGVEYFSKHIMMPMMKADWFAAEHTGYGEELRKKWVKQTMDSVDGESFEGLCKERDEGIIEILKYKKRAEEKKS